MTLDPDAGSSDLWAAVEATARRVPHRGVAILEGSASRGTWNRRTLPEVVTGARRTAARLAGRGVAPGQRVVVALPTSWEWIDVWLGALALGAWPVAAAPPGHRGVREPEVRRLQAVAEQLEARLAIMGSGLVEAWGGSPDSSLGIDALSPDQLLEGPPSAWQPGGTPGSDVAFLQLTSGTTKLPRAVMVSHHGVLHNMRAIDEGTGALEGAPAREWIDGWVSWLPLHHDMGLVGCLLQALVRGFDLWLLSPRTFLAAPVRWLEALGSHGVSFTTGPNFGYQFCLERVDPDDHPGLDLSSWRSAMVGAEMIQPPTIREFCECWQGRGFAATSIRPCYGLAEGTLALTLDQRAEGLRTARVGDDPAGSEVACVGQPVLDTEIRIVGGDGRQLPEGEEGEVTARGPGIALGYYNDPEATRSTFQDGWLVTGDLGFVRGGELYVTGRRKDLIIVRGQNIAPHEIEWLVEEVLAEGAAYRCAAFSVPGRSAGEEIVVIAETARGGEDWAAAARHARLRVADELYLPLGDLRPVRRGVIPRTTSGKLRRQALRARYLAGELDD